VIPIKRNHFYTKEIVSNAVGVYPQFKDLCVGASETTLVFKGGLGATQYIVSGNVSDSPRGAGELVGGFLQTYVTGMSISGTSILPEIVAYKLQNNFPISEGGFSLATGTTALGGSTDGTIGDKFWFSSAQLSSDAIWLEENFDGSNKSMGANLVLPGGGSAVLTIDDAYVTPKEGAEAIWAGGDAFFGGGANNDVEHNLGKYYSAGGPSGSRERVDVRPLKKNRIKGLWTAVNDHRNEKQKWQIYEPYWKWDGIRPILKFGKKDAVSENPDADKDANPENTVFNKLYKDSSIGTEQILSGTPMFSTTMTLEPSEAGGIGQSLSMKNHWGSGRAALNYWNWLSKAGMNWFSTGTKAPIQGMWASIYNIPYPLPNNIGGITQTLAENGAMPNGDQRVAFPEININMMIKNLSPSPAIDLSDAAIVGSNVRAYGDDDGPAGSAVGGTSLFATSDTDIRKQNKTFWRSVVITFSNYTPEEVSATCNLDEFIKYGLDYVYGNLEEDNAVAGINKYSETDGRLGPKIITGLVFETFYTASGGASTQDGVNNEYIDSNVAYAYTLPVCRFASGSGYNDSFGMAATTGGTDNFSPSGAMLHRPEIGTLIGSARSGYPYVKIPMNEFFNIKFIFDVQQPWNNTTSYGWYMEQNAGPVYSSGTAGGKGSGVPIRAYFNTLSPEASRAATADEQQAYDGTILPYINLALPAMDSMVAGEATEDAHYMCDKTMDGGNTRSSIGTGAPPGQGMISYFPKHMTIWVNNIGMAPARTATPAFWSGKNTWFDSTYWVSDDYGFPVLDAAGDVANLGEWTGPNPIATDILVDTITFKYWNNTMINMSTAAGTFSRFMKADNASVPSPAVQYTYATATDKYTKAFGADGLLKELSPGQNFVIGIKDVDWLPIVEAAPAGGSGVGAQTGYLLFNNFASKEFGLLKRNKPDAAWISTYVNPSADHLASNFAGYQMYGDLQISGTTRAKATQGAYNKMFITTGSTSDPDTTFGSDYDENAYMSMGYEGSGNWLSTDGLTQKGFLKFTITSGAAGSAATTFVARENVLTSAKIIAIAGAPPSDGTEEDNPAKNVIMVDNIDIFAKDLDDEYIIYRGGEYIFENPFDPYDALDDPFTVATCELTSGSNLVTHPATSNVNRGMAVSGTVSLSQGGLSSDTRISRGIPPNTYVINSPGTSATSFLMSKAATLSTDGTTTPAHNDITLTFNEAPRAALGYKHTIKMVTRDLTNSTVELVVTSGTTVLEAGITKADDDITDLCIPEHLYQLYISPKRYWINMMFSNDEWGPDLQYENICMIEETPATGSISTQLGSTYNEALYTYNTGNMTTKGLAAVKENPWIIGVSEEQSSLILSQDYGYGSYDGDKNIGGEASKNVPVLNTNSYFDISKMVQTISPGPGEEVSLVLGLNAEVSTKEVTIVGDDDTALDISGSTFYRPQYVWEYYDEIPEVNKFKVEPQFDLLSPDVNLYELTKQPINNLKFTWDESGEDIWYRHLIIATSGSIEDKYHRASMWIPFNEYGKGLWTAPSEGATDGGYEGPYSYYVNTDSGLASGTMRSGIATVFTADFVKPTITGIAGYTPQFIKDGVTTNVIVAGNWVEDDATRYELTTSMANEMGGSQTANPWVDEWSLVVHCSPDYSGLNAVNQTIAHARGTTVCGINTGYYAYRSGSLGVLPDAAPSVNIVEGNRTLPANDGNASVELSWELAGATDNTAGGFDVLHVYLKNNKVCVQYNHEFRVRRDSTTNNNAFYGQYEGLLLSSSTSYSFDGTEELAITITFNKNRLDIAESGTSTTTSNDQFQMYINGQLEDSESLKYGAYPQDVDFPTNSPPLGGFGRTNFNKFIVGNFNNEYNYGIEYQNGCGNIVADVGVDTGGGQTFATHYVSTCTYRGTIEEIILYPYEIRNVESAGEFIMDTATLPDYSGSGSGASELNYNARLFVYDYTNIRGRSTDRVASSTPVKWKVTGV